MKFEIKTSWLLFFRFKFYLYNDEGDLVQEQLSIHDIQHFLLHSTLPKSRLTKNAPSTTTSPPTTTTNFESSTSQVCSAEMIFFSIFFPEISVLNAQGHFYMNNLNSNGLLNPIMWYYLIIETSFLECLDGTKAFSVKTDFVWPQTFWWCAELQILSIALLPGKHWIRNCEPRSLCWERVVDCPFGGAG